ncbi:cyanophycinase [filamentous cyanobacterium CCP2]|nr:cyanophycinase [filamentous cyanobacterium CCP2]
MVAAKDNQEAGQRTEESDQAVSVPQETQATEQTKPTAQGQLIIIGGAEDKEGDCQILREFARQAGGSTARIVVMTVATGLPGEVGEQYTRIFERLGVEDVRVIDTARREDGDDPRALEILREATGVFFTGGDQRRITENLKGTETDRLLHERYLQGLVIAGTSAGAAMMPDMMIAEGEPQTNARVEVVEMEAGMAFLPGVVIDQHFAERGRLGRLLSAVVQQPVTLGFGIDENTAIVVSQGEFTVIGQGAITVIDVSKISHSNLSQSLKDEPLALCGATLHILPNGYRFDLKKRSPIWEGE